MIANAELARRELGWTPKYDDLDRIVADALTWKRLLARKNVVHGIQTPEPEKWLALPEKRALAKS